MAPISVRHKQNGLKKITGLHLQSALRPPKSATPVLANRTRAPKIFLSVSGLEQVIALNIVSAELEASLEWWGPRFAFSQALGLRRALLINLVDTGARISWIQAKA